MREKGGKKKTIKNNKQVSNNKKPIIKMYIQRRFKSL